MSISMVAFENGLGSCIMANIDRERLRPILNVPEGIEIELVVALGYPAHKAFVEEMRDDDARYWMDERGDFHVPKRELDEVLSWNSYSRK
jgi:hypothetical protein